MEDKLKQSEQAREQLAKELVRTKISLECADNTIKKQQKNIDELEAENAKLQSTIAKIKEIAITESFTSVSGWVEGKKKIIQLINESEEYNIE